MSRLQSKAAFEPAERLPGRHGVALYGIYEISKILCGPGDLDSILASTLGVLSSFLDMGNGLIVLPGDGGADTLVARTAGAGARRYHEALPAKALGNILATGIPLAVRDVALDTEFAWNTAFWGEPGQGFSCGCTAWSPATASARSRIRACWRRTGGQRMPARPTASSAKARRSGR
jgi:Nif-specific regulatory protein